MFFVVFPVFFGWQDLAEEEVREKERASNRERELDLHFTLLPCHVRA